MFCAWTRQVKAATWALERGVSVVICNGHQEKAIKTIMSGRKLGTFFTDAAPTGQVSTDVLAESGKTAPHTLRDLYSFILFFYRVIKRGRRGRQGVKGGGRESIKSHALTLTNPPPYHLVFQQINKWASEHVHKYDQRRWYLVQQKTSPFNPKPDLEGGGGGVTKT